MTPSSKSRREIEDTVQIMRQNLSYSPEGHIIDVRKLPKSLGKWLPHLVALGADLSHDTVLLAYPKGQGNTFIVVRKPKNRTR